MGDNTQNTFQLIIKQQPVHSRMCGIVDRRPIDPPPVVQIKLNTPKNDMEKLSELSSYLFLIALLIPADDSQEQPDILLHSKLTVGRTVSSLYILRDLDGKDGAFFVFSDISVRTEGIYRLRMCLFDIRQSTVNYNISVTTNPFTVYSAKTFPGMYRSCLLVQSFARQGLKIRIRKESGPRPARYIDSVQKKKKKKNTNLILKNILQSDMSKKEAQKLRDNEMKKKVPKVLPSTNRLSLSYLLDDSSTLIDNTESFSPKISTRSVNDSRETRITTDSRITTRSASRFKADILPAIDIMDTTLSEEDTMETDSMEMDFISPTLSTTDTMAPTSTTDTMASVPVRNMINLTEFHLRRSGNVNIVLVAIYILNIRTLDDNLLNTLPPIQSGTCNVS
ncbi:velvet factor-domain-containing protein [Pilobolus umbonatus]|nr:velvet factor-domain-containing protein [Pilobolus umbonatus]